MPLLRSLPEQPVMRDLYKSQPASCKPLGELTEVAMRGPSPFTQGQRELIAAYVSGLMHAGIAIIRTRVSPPRLALSRTCSTCSCRTSIWHQWGIA
jgi:hypothetical protein